MTDSIFDQRRKALEETFFAKRDQELLESLRRKLTTAELKKQLAELSGISDDRLLEHLVSAGIGPQTLAALMLVPLIMIAWCDEIVQPDERKLILKAAMEDGIQPSDPAYRLLESWLTEKPDSRLLNDWKAYVAALKQRLAPQTVDELREKIVGRARRIARIAGGFFGWMATTEAEERLIRELEAAFR
jgi:hypothetical protein